jgi:hypothetical protein
MRHDLLRAWRLFLFGSLALLWLEMPLAHAASIAPPPLDFIDATRLDYNNRGFEIDTEVYAFPDVEAAVGDFRQRLGGPTAPISPVRTLVTIEGFEFLSVAGIRVGAAPRQHGSALLARRLADGQTWNLFEISIDDGVGGTGPLEYFQSPAGPLLRLPVPVSGTGAFNEDFLFLWRDGAWQEIDTRSWLRTLKLPPGHGIWKGVVVDPRTFSARSSVWRDGDGNCCPSGGEVDVRLALKGRRLEIESQSCRPDCAQ